MEEKDLVKNAANMTEMIGQLTNKAPAIEHLGIPAYNWLSDDEHGVSARVRAYMHFRKPHYLYALPKKLKFSFCGSANLEYTLLYSTACVRALCVRCVPHTWSHLHIRLTLWPFFCVFFFLCVGVMVLCGMNRTRWLFRCVAQTARCFRTGLALAPRLTKTCYMLLVSRTGS